MNYESEYLELKEKSENHYSHYDLCFKNHECFIKFYYCLLS